MGSFLPWGSLCLVIFLLLQSMFHYSSGCSVEERAALLDIQSSLRTTGSFTTLDSWGEGDQNCCSWEDVKCDNSTQRVTHLDLSELRQPTHLDLSGLRQPTKYPWYVNSTVFSVFHELQYLDLSDNYPCLLSLEGFIGLAKLRHLDLSYTTLGVGFVQLIGDCVSLEVLVLNYINITDTSLPSAAFENLVNLQHLSMSWVAFSGNIPASLFALPRLKILDLSGNNFGGNIPISSSSGPISLQVIDLSDNFLRGTLPAVTAFTKLRSLDLSFNQFSGSLPVSLFALPRLKFLDLSQNNFEGRFHVSSSLKPVPLEVLYLDGNNMSGALPSERALDNLQNLRELSLSSNQFSGNIPAVLFSLPHIERLNLSQNSFEGPILISSSSNLSLSLKSLRLSRNKLRGRISFISLQNLTKLEEIDLSGNANLIVDVNISGWIPRFQLKQLLLSGCDLDERIIAEPHFLRTQSHLEELDLSNNNLSGSMPNWLFTKEATLNILNLGNNSLTGSLDSIWHAQYSLFILDIHMNHVAGQLQANINSMLPHLEVLDLSSNNFFGHIPTSLCDIAEMQILDLSNNKLSGEVPACLFTDYAELSILQVSNNKLGGHVFSGVNSLSAHIYELYLDSNKFYGTIPHNLSGSLIVMDLHDNELSGQLHTSFWNMPYLQVLNLAGNRITGKIHPRLCGLTRIRLLDLSRNNLTGSLPKCTIKVLNFLNMSGNSLSGDISNSFFDTSSLLALDIRHNQFTGNLHWLHYLHHIRLLFLGGNKFEGQISPHMCKLLHLRIIDLSHNKLTGSLPACIGKITFKGNTDDPIFREVVQRWGFTPDFSPDYRSYMGYDFKSFAFATKGNLYTYGRSFFVSMSGIDLSANMLDGEIPWQLGNLSHIKSLNLSNNFFVGPIPTTFGGMEEIESLDLSHNELSGPIPWQLTQLSSLGMFSVAYNNLSGCIPNTGQLGSFGMESYLANTNLHEITRGNMCTPGPDPVAGEDVAETPVDPVLYAVTAAAFVLAFWATVGFSFCHPYGRSVMLKL